MGWGLGIWIVGIEADVLFTCRLAKRLPKMLFPPGTSTADFEYETALGVLVRYFLDCVWISADVVV